MCLTIGGYSQWISPLGKLALQGGVLQNRTAALDNEGNPAGEGAPPRGMRVSRGWCFSRDGAGSTLEPGMTNEGPQSPRGPPLFSPLPPGREGAGSGNTQPFSTGLKTGNIDKTEETHTHGEAFRCGVTVAPGRLMERGGCWFNKQILAGRKLLGAGQVAGPGLHSTVAGGLVPGTLCPASWLSVWWCHCEDCPSKPPWREPRYELLACLHSGDRAVSPRPLPGASLSWMRNGSVPPLRRLFPPLIPR